MLDMIFLRFCVNRKLSEIVNKKQSFLILFSIYRVYQIILSIIRSHFSSQMEWRQINNLSPCFLAVEITWNGLGADEEGWGDRGVRLYPSLERVSPFLMQWFSTFLLPSKSISIRLMIFYFPEEGSRAGKTGKHKYWESISRASFREW